MQDYLEPVPDDLDEEAPAAVPTFTDEDVARYEALDKRIDRGEREMWEGVRDIYESGRTPKPLWLVPRSEDGQPLYPTFKRWCEDYKGKSRSAVTKGLNWLRLMEAQERLGLHYGIGPKAAQALQGIETPEQWAKVGGLGAVLAEAAGEKLDKDGRISHAGALKVVSRRKAYFLPDEPGHKPAAATYEEYQQDCEAVRAFAETLPVKPFFGLVWDAQQRGAVGETLLPVCREKRAVPQPATLLPHFTGEALVKMLADLGALSKEFGEGEAKLKELWAAEDELKKASQPLSPLRQHVTELRKAAEEAGLIKPKSKRNRTTPPPPDDDDDQQQGDQGDVTDEEAVGEVLDHLDDAQVSLKSALDVEFGANDDIRAKAAELADLLSEIVLRAAPQEERPRTRSRRGSSRPPKSDPAPAGVRPPPPSRSVAYHCPTGRTPTTHFLRVWTQLEAR